MKADATRMPIHGLEFFTYVYCRLYVSYVQDSLVRYVLFIWYSLPVDSPGNQVYY